MAANILCLDVDSFEVEFWMREKRTDLVGKDVPVILASHFVIISVNYSAKAGGITRDTPLQTARQKCPDVVILHPDEENGLVDTFSPYKKKDEILDVLLQMNDQRVAKMIIERSESSDEIYVDMTGALRSGGSCSSSDADALRDSIHDLVTRKKIHPCKKFDGDPYFFMEHKHGKASEEFAFCCNRCCGDSCYICDDCLLKVNPLLSAALLADDIIQDIRMKTGMTVSGGLAYNKFVAKLAVGRNKPAGICVITPKGFARLRKELFVKDIPGFQNVIGEKLVRKYEDVYGDAQMTLDDVRRLKQRGLRQLFRRIGGNEKDNETIIQDLLKKSKGLDDTPVTAAVFSEKMSLSTGLDRAKNRIQFNKQIRTLAEAFCQKLQYLRLRYKMSPEEVAVNFKFTKDFTGNIAIPNRLKITDWWGMLEPDELLDFSRKLMLDNKIDWDVCKRITFGTSHFQEIAFCLTLFE